MGEGNAAGDSPGHSRAVTLAQHCLTADVCTERRTEKCSGSFPQLCPCDFGSRDVSRSGISDLKVCSVISVRRRKVNELLLGVSEHCVCTRPGFQRFSLCLISASQRVTGESQALADFQYLHCVLHPDSKLHQWPEQIHQASYQLSDTAGCLCLPCSRVFLPLIQLPCSVFLWQQGNAGNVSLCPSGCAPC